MNTRPSLFLLAAAGAALFWVASAIGLFVHEVIGHGGTALTLGYPLLGFYVSPIEGFELSQTPPTLEGTRLAIIRLGGPVATVLVGLLSLAGIGRSRGAVARSFFLYLGLFCLDGTLAYAAADLALRTGEGDFSVAFAVLKLPGTPLAAMAFAGALLIVIWFSRMALGIIQGFWPLTSYRRRVAALCLCFLPGPLLQGAYLAAVHNLMRPGWVMAIALAVALALFGAAVGSIVAAALPVRPAGRAVVPRASLVRVLAVCVPALAVLVAVFGPTNATARAALVRYPSDEWMPKPPITNLDLIVERDLAATATFLFKLVPDPFPAGDASSIHRRIFDHLNRQTTAWAYYETFVTGSAAAMIGVVGRPTNRAMGREIWFNGREAGDARAVTLSAELNASPNLRHDAGGYALRIVVSTLDPVDGGRRSLERLRVTAGPGLRLQEAMKERGGRTSPQPAGPTGVVWTHGPGEPPDAIVVRFRRDSGG